MRVCFVNLPLSLNGVAFCLLFRHEFQPIESCESFIFRNICEKRDQRMCERYNFERNDSLVKWKKME